MRRSHLLLNDEVYHIFNRGVDKRIIFPDQSYYDRFIKTLQHCLIYRYPYSLLLKRLKKARNEETRKSIHSLLEIYRIAPTVQIVSFCLMPNHYHLCIKQLADNGISDFIHRLSTGYSNYFNIRNSRTGSLFENRFKSVRVESNEQLIHLSRYHHLNPRSIGISYSEELIAYPWSSLAYYLNEKTRPQHSFVHQDIILTNFKNIQSYREFVFTQSYETHTSHIEDLIFDEEDEYSVVTLP